MAGADMLDRPLAGSLRETGISIYRLKSFPSLFVVVASFRLDLGKSKSYIIRDSLSSQ